MSGKLYESELITDRVVRHFPLDERETDVTASVREQQDCAPTITMVEGTCHETYHVTNLFAREANGDTTVGRALFLDETNVIQYDIPDAYNPGYPIVLSRFALIPCVGNSDYNQKSVDPMRAPSQFKLEGSADGEAWVTLYETDGTGWGPGRFMDGDLTTTKGNNKGHLGVVVNIPEENRGD